MKISKFQHISIKLNLCQSCQGTYYHGRVFSWVKGSNMSLYKKVCEKNSTNPDHDASLCDALCHPCTFRAHADGVPNQNKQTQKYKR